MLVILLFVCAVASVCQAARPHAPPAVPPVLAGHVRCPAYPVRAVHGPCHGQAEHPQIRQKVRLKDAQGITWI